MFEIFG